ncbi:PREDICTED: uncharacterized protein LOC106813608 [Priapulus caudatus]|uniref:Uncharacterized protein LOC106813608 n=1 Tax=Priapulus caudatus TaxID=37621 RepID=A0ABM1EM56_PRICU|nr:PREDICTED: uncharacterized protein LOC106813608 [Priapulus caudatus]
MEHTDVTAKTTKDILNLGAQHREQAPSGGIEDVADAREDPMDVSDAAEVVPAVVSELVDSVTRQNLSWTPPDASSPVPRPEQSSASPATMTARADASLSAEKWEQVKPQLTRRKLHETEGQQDQQRRAAEGSSAGKPKRTQTRDRSPLSDPDRKTKTSIQVERDLPLIRLWLCIISAVVCRLSVAMGIAIIFEYSIVGPFICLQLGFLAYERLILEDIPSTAQQQNMVVAALMLSGVPPNVIEQVNGVTARVTLIATDFAVFFFTFVLVHTIFSIVGL